MCINYPIRMLHSTLIIIIASTCQFPKLQPKPMCLDASRYSRLPDILEKICSAFAWSYMECTNPMHAWNKSHSSFSYFSNVLCRLRSNREQLVSNFSRTLIIGNFDQSDWHLVAKIWSTETTLFFMEEVLFFQFFEKWSLLEKNL